MPLRRVDPEGRAVHSGVKLLVGIVIAVVVVGLAITLFHFLLGYGLIFLSAIGAFVLIRQLILGSRMRVRLEGSPENKRQTEKRAHRELKQMEKQMEQKIRR
jgi:hypothetical protein